MFGNRATSLKGEAPGFASSPRDEFAFLAAHGVDALLLTSHYQLLEGLLTRGGVRVVVGGCGYVGAGCLYSPNCRVSGAREHPFPIAKPRRSQVMLFTRLAPRGILDLGEPVAGCGRRTVMDNGNSVKKLVGAVLLCEVAGGIGSALTRNGLRDWYPNLEKPSFTPPGWIFGPVWTLLYAMMGVSFYLVSQQRGEDSGEVRSSRILFGIQLILNVLWSYVFFGRRSPGWALVEIGFLWVAIAATIRSFWTVSKTAALLLLPYILWVSFAVLLNYSIWRLNR